MRVLVVGGGGREHALAWRLSRSPQVEGVWCAPGNAGIADVATCVALAPDDVKGLARFARDRAIDLTVVGPEMPLTLGVVDRFAQEGLRAFGPTAAAARLEGSKVFAKELLRQLRVPTAFFGAFDDADQAARFIDEVGAPVVVKADGLAAGKGVFICHTVREAKAAVDQIMRQRLFGDAGERVVVEEFLQGEELSFMAITDGDVVLPLAESQDHKRVLDGDRGPNTGGMGAYSPVPLMTPELRQHVMRDIMEPVVTGLDRQGTRYTGVLYAGLMVHEGQAKVLEFNVRFGDPEAQVLMMRLKSDLAALMDAVVEGTLADVAVEWDPRAAACVVLAAEGYPGVVERGRPIDGLDALRGWTNGMVFHAGTRRDGDRVVTDGGRVLGVTAMGDTIAGAVASAYEAVARIGWPGMQFRADIGHRATGRPGEQRS
jgi:phosphoribosylamine--glycine ligase